MSESFIFTGYIQNLSICDEIIEWFNTTERKGPGQLSLGRVDLNSKASTDTVLQENPELFDRYCLQLKGVVDKYVEKYTYANYYSPFNVIENTNIQYYKPGEGFYSWHTERTGIRPPCSGRHLVFMTYLNDVEEGGETEFYYQQVKIQPKKGLTVIWPADWTHTHRGVTSMTQEKYIVTGWYNYTS